LSFIKKDAYEALFDTRANKWSQIVFGHESFWKKEGPVRTIKRAYFRASLKPRVQMNLYVQDIWMDKTSATAYIHVQFLFLWQGLDEFTHQRFVFVFIYTAAMTPFIFAYLFMCIYYMHIFFNKLHISLYMYTQLYIHLFSSPVAGAANFPFQCSL
ncbi:hypothetical protein ACJX0J_032392, partial [Zea mays]